METKQKTIYALVLALLAGPLVAAPAASVAQQLNIETPADKLAALQAQRALNRLRVDVARQEAEIGEAKQKSASAAPVLAPVLTSPNRIKPISPAEMPPPSVVSIAGVGDQFSATVFTGGLQKVVRAGDALAGGWVVAKIDSAGVRVVRGTQVNVLRP